MFDRVDWMSFKPVPVLGVDEAGRGCLAGPVFAAAVVLKFHEPDTYFDSKTLTEKRREDLFARIQERHEWAVGIATVEEIGEINILRASLLAMKRAIEGLRRERGHVLIDGKIKVPGLSRKFKQTTLIKGDLRCDPISAASIIAKVSRDRWMKKLAEEFPDYGFEVHKGYGTEMHRRALARLGPTPHHRLGFRGVLPNVEGQSL
jgi:ribonuclease HII